ncbi:hypothetical protein [Mesorhizobium sp.]|nr:hypothetical protein [Mesorhizobium sp.]
MSGKGNSGVAAPVGMSGEQVAGIKEKPQQPFEIAGGFMSKLVAGKM